MNTLNEMINDIEYEVGLTPNQADFIVDILQKYSNGMNIGEIPSEYLAWQFEALDKVSTLVDVIATGNIVTKAQTINKMLSVDVLSQALYERDDVYSETWDKEALENCIGEDLSDEQVAFLVDKMNKRDSAGAAEDIQAAYSDYENEPDFIALKEQYCVTTLIDSDGHIRCRPSVEHDVADSEAVYIDRFDTLDEANAFIKECEENEAGAYCYYRPGQEPAKVPLSKDAASLAEVGKEAKEASEVLAGNNRGVTAPSQEIGG